MATVGDIIDKLGGGVAAARKFRVTPSAISQWRTRNELPPGRNIEFWWVAREIGVDWTPPGADGLDLVAKQAAE